MIEIAHKYSELAQFLRDAGIAAVAFSFLYLNLLSMMRAKIQARRSRKK
jgi:hypothetical protein